MKKIIALLMAMIMVFALVACGGKGAEDLQAAKEAAANGGVTEVNVDEMEMPDTFTTVTEGKLTMATNAQFPPYEFYEGTEIVGIDAEIAAEVANRLGLELVIEDMEFDSIIEAVKSGKADIGMAGMTVTPERQEVVDFTPSYATGIQAIIVAEGNDTIAGTNDDGALVDAEGNVLEGLTIGVQRGTTGDLYSTWNMEDAGLATVDRYSKGADAVQALRTGKVDCVIIDNQPALAFVAEVEGLKILETAYAVEDYAGAMSKSNTALYEAVCLTLAEMIEDGTVAAIVGKYISTETSNEEVAEDEAEAETEEATEDVAEDVTEEATEEVTEEATEEAVEETVEEAAE